MKTYIQPGEHLTLTASADTAAGSFVAAGALSGVAQGTVASGDPVVLLRRGIFALPKVATEAWTVGAKIYFDAETGQMTADGTDRVQVGAAVEATASPSDTGLVLLDGVLR